MRTSLSISGLLMLAGVAAAAAEPSTTLLHNAQIYTVNAAQPWASAMVIDKGGRIVAIGSDEDVAEYVDDETEKVDLEGRLMLPGFQGTHAHVLDATSEAQGDCKVEAADSVQQWLQEIKACNSKDDGEWLLGWGFSIGYVCAELGVYPLTLLTAAYLCRNPDLGLV